MRKQVILLLLAALAWGNQVNAQWVISNNGLIAIKGLKNANVRVLAISGSLIFAGTTNGVFISNNNGVLWTKAKLPVALVENKYSEIVVTAIAVNGKNVFVSTEEGIFFSSNNGVSWVESNAGLQKNYYTNKPDIINTVAVIGNTVFAGTSEQVASHKTVPNTGGVFISTDNGKNWKPSNEGLEERDLQDLSVSGKNIFASTRHSTYISTDGLTWKKTENLNSKCATAGAITFACRKQTFLSKDNGLTWTLSNNGLPKDNAVRSITTNGSIAFAAVEDVGIYFTKDSGKLWSSINGDLPNFHIYAIAINGDNVLVGTNNGIWKRSLKSLVK